MGTTFRDIDIAPGEVISNAYIEFVCDDGAAERLAVLGPPTNLGTSVNGPYYERTPSISSDGFTLYFGSDRSGGFGSVDLWQASILPIVDFNGDGLIDLVDLVMLIDAWGTDDSLCDIGPMPWGDGKVDIEDLKVFMTYYEKENPPVLP